MRKIIVFSLVLSICLLGVTQLAFAAEAAVSPGGSQRTCFLDLLPDDTREQVESIIEEYYEKMMALREKMQDYRISGDRDKLAEAREGIWDLKQERQDAIAPYIPEDYREEFASRGYEKQQTHRPGERSFKHGWEKSNGASIRAGSEF